MADNPARDDLTQLRDALAAQRAVTDQLRADLARLRRRRRAPHRLLPLALVALLVALVPLAALAVTPFTDLNAGSVHNANIDAIYQAGITRGCVPDVAYCPNDFVTRQEMASFLARTAGLGSNPPVAHALTAQTADTATNATHATGADNATTVGGLAPNGLVRVARAGTTAFAITAVTSPCYTYVPLKTLTLTAPAAGFILVTSAVGVAHEAGTGESALQARLRDQSDAAGANASPESYGYVQIGNADAETVTSTWVFPVTAGDRTIVLDVCRRQRSGAETIDAINPQLTALFVPFGSTGASTLGTPEEPAPAAPGSGGGRTGP